MDWMRHCTEPNRGVFCLSHRLIWDGNSGRVPACFPVPVFRCASKTRPRTMFVRGFLMDKKRKTTSENTNYNLLTGNVTKGPRGIWHAGIFCEPAATVLWHCGYDCGRAIRGERRTCGNQQRLHDQLYPDGIVHGSCDGERCLSRSYKGRGGRAGALRESVGSFAEDDLFHSAYNMWIPAWSGQFLN